MRWRQTNRGFVYVEVDGQIWLLHPEYEYFMPIAFIYDRDVDTITYMTVDQYAGKCPDWGGSIH